MTSIIYMDVLIGQVRTTWVGGTPGRESDWFCAKNWSKNQVPNEFNIVVIPDVSTSTFVYPVIKKGEAIVQNVEIIQGAKLSVDKSGVLVIIEQMGQLDTMNMVNCGKIIRF